MYLFDVMLLELVLLTPILLSTSFAFTSFLMLDGSEGLALACEDLAKLLMV